MPFYAQRADLPDTHRHYADEGSELAASFARIGYVQVSGDSDHDEDTGDVDDFGDRVPPLDLDDDSEG